MNQTRSPSSDESSRRWLVAYRWIEILAEAGIGTAAFLLLSFAFRSHLPILVTLPTWIFPALVVCVTTILWFTGRGRWAGFFGLRNFHVYPPPWLACLIGSALAIFAVTELPWDFPPSLPDQSIDTTLLATEQWIFFGLLFGVFSTVAILLNISHFQTETQSTCRGSPSTLDTPVPTNFSSLERWLKDDRPVTERHRDAFGLWRVADRIASRLADNESSAQAIIGALGSGKTTLRYLVHESLRMLPRESRPRLVSVELWPYENAKAAVSGVITALVDELGSEVSVLSLRGLPASYAEAMSAAGGVWSAAVRLQGVPSNPFDALRSIDKLAKTIGRRYVVWIEDLERFAGERSAQTIEDRLNPLRALLYGLDQLDSVTVVMATISLHKEWFDIEKIARYTETLHKLPARSTQRFLALLRTACRTDKSIIDPAAQRARKDLDELGDEYDPDLIQRFLGPGVYTVAGALVELCSTPRVLKKALRTCLDTWRRLAGEIDCDDVLALSILREAQPKVFALIQDHITFWRGDREREEFKAAKSHWEAAFAILSLDTNTRAATERILDFLFGQTRANGNPQGVRQNGHADYWDRFLSIPILTEDERDQPVIKALTKKQDESILDILESEHRSVYIEDFNALLASHHLLQLLVPLVRRRSIERPNTWSNNDPPGLVPLWRMLTRRGQFGNIDPVAFWNSLQIAYNVSVPKNLELASSLERYFVTSSRSIYKLLQNPEVSYQEAAKSYLRRLIVSTFSSKELELIRALDGATPTTMSWLTWGLDRIQDKDISGLPFDEWADFAPTVLRAAELSKRTLLPQIAAMITEQTNTEREIRYTYRAERTAQLFGSEGAVLHLFYGENLSDWDDPHVASVLAIL